MFKFLKDKLKKAVSQFSRKIEEEGKEEVKEVEVKSKPAKKEKPSKLRSEKKEKSKTQEKPKVQKEEAPKKKGFFAKLKEKISGVSELEKIPEEEFEEVQVKEEKKPEIKKEKPKPKVEKPKSVKEKKPEAAPAVFEKEEEEAGKEKISEKEEKIEIPKEEVKKEEPKVEEKIEIEKPEPQVEEKPAEKEEIEEKKEEPAVEEKPEVKEEPDIKEGQPEEKKGFFAKLKEKIVTKKISAEQFESMFWDLEIILLENNVAVEVIEKIKEDLKQNIVDKPLPRTKIINEITGSLKQTIKNLFAVEKIDLIKKAKEKKPLVICFVGINGSGKTTTIAKMVKLFQNNGLSCVMAASDTFRAAAIDQLQKHADNLGVKLIKHDYGSDAAAVAFDAVKHAQAKNIDIVLIDTAGRMHSNVNLMEEMEKIIRVAKPDLKIFVGESITGNDCTEQAQKFNESIGIDGIVLSKADVDEKGGAAISVSHVTGKPILYLGIGQNYEDLKEFDPSIVLKSLDLE